jgi:hypothetical protein
MPSGIVRVAIRWQWPPLFARRSFDGTPNSLMVLRGRVAEWFKAAVLKTARGFTLPRGFESHPFRQDFVHSRPWPFR